MTVLSKIVMKLVLADDASRAVIPPDNFYEKPWTSRSRFEVCNIASRLEDSKSIRANAADNENTKEKQREVETWATDLERLSNAAQGPCICGQFLHSCREQVTEAIIWVLMPAVKQVATSSICCQGWDIFMSESLPSWVHSFRHLLHLSVIEPRP